MLFGHDEGKNLKQLCNGEKDVICPEMGGTGGDSLPKARQNLNFLGTNPIASAEEDTPENWIALGTGIAFISTSGKLKNQPTPYGYVENYTDGNYIYQAIHSLNGSSTVWSRSGTKAKWYDKSANWVKQLDENNGAQIKKAWTNTSPTSIFKGQTITAQQMGLTDLSSYNKAFVSFKWYNSIESLTPTITCEKGTVIRPHLQWDSSYVYYRSIKLDDSGVTFGDCYYGKLLQNNSIENTGLIPVEIYLVKGVL